MEKQGRYKRARIEFFLADLQHRIPAGLFQGRCDVFAADVAFA